MLKLAYKRQCMKWHPDRQRDRDGREKAKNVFWRVQSANKVLSDPLARTAYISNGYKDVAQ